MWNCNIATSQNLLLCPPQPHSLLLRPSLQRLLPRSLVRAYADDLAVVLPAGTLQCNSLGSASIVYERLKFVTALPKRVDGETCVETGTVLIGNCAPPAADDTCGAGCEMLTGYGFHQGPAYGPVDNPEGDGNRGGSYLTMMSLPGFLFGIINVVAIITKHLSLDHRQTNRHHEPHETRAERCPRHGDRHLSCCV